VDPISRRRFWDVIQDLSSRGVTILVTTHFMDEAEFCRRIAFINAGRLAALGTPHALRHDALNEDVFEVVPADSHGAAERIERADGVAGASYFGPLVHAFCPRGRHTPASLEAALRAQGLRVTDVQPVPPTLEDAFIRLSQREAPAGGGASGP
jgi:ABC-2 type transport system ATP-binding protein